MTSAPGESSIRRIPQSSTQLIQIRTLRSQSFLSSEHGFGGDRQRASEAGQKGGSASYEVRSSDLVSRDCPLTFPLFCSIERRID
jgi:hypothetical protein